MPEISLNTSVQTHSLFDCVEVLTTQVHYSGRVLPELLISNAAAYEYLWKNRPRLGIRHYSGSLDFNSSVKSEKKNYQVTCFTKYYNLSDNTVFISQYIQSKYDTKLQQTGWITTLHNINNIRQLSQFEITYNNHFSTNKLSKL